jgi:hypothetical protein
VGACLRHDQDANRTAGKSRPSIHTITNSDARAVSGDHARTAILAEGRRAEQPREAASAQLGRRRR